jgi:hypothetical protein
VVLLGAQPGKSYTNVGLGYEGLPEKNTKTYLSQKVRMFLTLTPAAGDIKLFTAVVVAEL